MKIGFFGLENEQDKKDYYAAALNDHEVQFYDECLNPDNPPEHLDFDIISIFVGCKVNQKIIDAMPNLKMIAIRSTGFDNVDLEYTKQKNIVVSNVPAYGSHTVAEFAFALLLDLSRHITKATIKLKGEKVIDKTGLRGFDLFGKTIGIIGTGKIGANAIRIAKGFEMNVIAFDAYPNNQLAEQLGFSYVSLEDLLRQSDVVSIHAPSNDQTYHMINKNNIYQMKRGSVLVNTARGKIVETEALFDSLKSGHLQGAGVDVFENESELTEIEKELIALDNVVVSPHVAFYSKEAEQAIMDTTVKNIQQFLASNPQNRVN